MHANNPRKSGPLARFLIGDGGSRGFMTVALAAVVIQQFVADGLTRGLVAAAIFTAATGALVTGVRRNRPHHPGPWWLLVVAMIWFSVNIWAWSLELARGQSALAVFVMDATKLVGALFLVGSVGWFIHLRRINRRRDTLVDGTLILAGGALMLWQWYLLIISRNSPGIDAAELGPLVLVGLMLTVGLALYRMVGGTGLGSTSARLLTTGTVLTVFSQGALTLTVSDGPEPRWTDPTWLVPAVLVAGAALHPSMKVLTRAKKVRQGLAPRLVIAGAALLANPLLILVQLLDEQRDRLTIIIVMSAVALVLLIGIWRVGLLIMQLDDARTALGRSERRFRSLVQRASEVVAVIDNGGTLTYISPASRGLLGFSPESLLGSPIESVVAPADRKKFRAFLLTAANLEQEGSEDIEVTMRTSHRRPTRAEIVAVNLQNDRDVRGIALTIRDVTIRAQVEAKLRHLASHDSLTGLANRDTFQDRVAMALARAGRSGALVGVVFIDLDDFKTVNDSLGHLVGDQLLQLVGARIEESLRAADTAARLGGDEFAILLEDIEDPADADEVIDRVQRALRRPVTLEGRAIHVGATMGLALGVAGDTPAELLRNADTAMFNAKNAGKDRFHRFQPEMHVAAVSRFDLKADLSNALERDEFLLHYQPVFDLGHGRVRGFEALIRWQHPTRGLVMPNDFIPLMEETGQIVPVGRWAMQEAFNRAAGWYRTHPAAGRPTIGVNLSVRQFQQPDLVADIRAAIDGAGIVAGDVVVEITESVFIGDTDAAVERLEELQSLGVSLAIDDFGTGYSALGYLQRFRADIVKVDKSFVETLGGHESDRTLTGGIVDLARALGIVTVAEGVERPDQVVDLRAMECDLAQGFHLARPMPAVDLTTYLEQRQAV